MFVLSCMGPSENADMIILQYASKLAKTEVSLLHVPTTFYQPGVRPAGNKIALCSHVGVCVCVCVCVLVRNYHVCKGKSFRYYSTIATSTVEVCRLNRPRYIKHSLD